jgi:hypothetical protein
MDFDRCAGLLLLGLLLAGATATRQLEAAPDATKGSRDPSQTLTYHEALSNSSCHGFLIGIGTQKGVLTQPGGDWLLALGAPSTDWARACVLATAIDCILLLNAFFSAIGVFCNAGLPCLTVC